ncbi:MAG: cohesin domain-containing protein [Phycisphaerae bacterium]
MTKHREEAPMRIGINGRLTATIALIVAMCAGLMAVPAAMADELSLGVAPGSETVMPCDTLIVTLEVADLTAAINGVQALIRYDDTILSLVDITPTDLGLTPPDEGWVEVAFADPFGDVTYAVVINGSSSIVDGTVATLTFDVIDEGSSVVEFRPDSPPFLTKLTVASDNSTVLPDVVPTPTIVSACDDGLYCNGTETFSGVACQAGTPPDCSVLTTQCSDGVCNEGTDACEAQPINEGLDCDDNDLCTENDTCIGGVCSSTPVGCSFLDDPCNVGTCNPSDGSCEAVPANEGGSCDDGVYCNGTDTCDTGVCVSSGDPCVPLFCDEGLDTCLAPVQVDSLEVFYAGRYADLPDPSKMFLAAGETATNDNITNYIRGITGIRVIFNAIVDFATSPEDAFTFEWTTGTGTTFSPVTDVATAIMLIPSEQNSVTVIDILLADDHVRRRWLKVTIDATQVTTSGVELDGELMGSPMVFPSGDTAPGGDAVFYLGNLTGDVDGDRKTQLADVVQIRAAVNPFFVVPITDVYDVDKDGKVQLTDVGLCRLEVNPFFAIPLITP